MNNSINVDVIERMTAFDDFYSPNKCASTIFTGVIVIMIFLLMVFRPDSYWEWLFVRVARLGFLMM